MQARTSRGTAALGDLWVCEVASEIGLDISPHSCSGTCCCSPTRSYTWPTQEHFVVETSGPSGIKRTFCACEKRDDDYHRCIG